MKIKIKESHIWFLLMGVIMGSSSVYISEGDYIAFFLNLGAYGIILIVWRVILWVLLKIPIVKKHCS